MGKTRVFHPVARLRSYATTIFTDGGEREREREEAGDAWRSWTREYSLQRGSFLANFSSLSLSLSVDRKHFKKRFERGRRRGRGTREGKKRSSGVVPVYFFAGVMECKVPD